MDISFVSVIYSFSFTTDSEHGVQTFNQSKLAIQKPAREICRRPFLENEDVCPHVIQILVDSCYCSGAFLHENHFFFASEKVSFLNAEAWKNLIELCLYHSQQSYANLRWKIKMQRKPAYIGGRLDECKEKSRKEIKTPPNLFSIHHENM